MNFVKKHWILLSIVVLLLVGAGYRYSYLILPVEFKDYGDWLEEKPRSLGEIKRYSDALVEAYEQDDIGGKTPEETLQLWVEAVKADDLEKASLYFLVDYRKEALEGMKISKKNNVLPEIVEDIENGGKFSISVTGNRASFDTATQKEKINGNLGFDFRFVKNPHTSVWKIEEF